MSISLKYKYIVPFSTLLSERTSVHKIVGHNDGCDFFPLLSVHPLMLMMSFSFLGVAQKQGTNSQLTVVPIVRRVVA
jgi:hypothetical protein